MKSTDARDNFVWGVDAGVFCTKYGWKRYGKVDKIDAIAPHYSIFCLFYFIFFKASKAIRQSWSLTFRTFSLIQYIYLTAELIAFVFVALLRKLHPPQNNQLHLKADKAEKLTVDGVLKYSPNDKYFITSWKNICRYLSAIMRWRTFST